MKIISLDELIHSAARDAGPMHRVIEVRWQASEPTRYGVALSRPTHAPGVDADWFCRFAKALKSWPGPVDVIEIASENQIVTITLQFK
jgi:hypothetical protein